MKEILDVIHKTIYQFFDVCGDDEEVPISDKDKLLLEVNKAICNNLKALEQEPCEDCRTCNKWSECECGEKGHKNGTSIGYSIGGCKDYEPCEDCISRQAVNTLVDELARAMSDERCCMSRGRSTSSIMQAILDLPPVTPQPKIGHWMLQPPDMKELGKGFIWRKCSECGQVIITPSGETEQDIQEYHAYCGRCGAKMIEKEE
jgi:hypothetical protein